MREINLRRRLFTVVSFSLIWALLTNDIIGWVDECLLAYSIVSLLYMFAVVASVIYWAKFDRVSSVFKWLVILMSGGFLNTTIQGYARWLFVQGRLEEYNSFLVCRVWHYRYLPILIALSYLFALIVGRFMVRGKDGQE